MFTHNAHFTTTHKEQGAYIYTGAHLTVLGLTRANASSRYMIFNFQPKKSTHRYNFGDDTQETIGSITIYILINRLRVGIVNIDAFNVDIPFLLGLDILEQYRMYENMCTNAFCGRHLI